MFLYRFLMLEKLQKFSVISHTVRGVYLEHNRVPTLTLIIERLNQRRIRDFEHFNLFNGNEMIDSDSKIWIWGHSILYRFMKSINSHYECTRKSADLKKCVAITSAGSRTFEKIYTMY